MKNTIRLFMITLTSILLSCTGDSMSETITYNINEPIVMDAKIFRKAIVINTQGKEIRERGKILFHNTYMYINEPEKGIHIFDISNLETPTNKGFIELIGNTDFVIQGSTLYANAFIDMVWFDISNPALPKEKGRLENIFQSALPRIENRFGVNLSQNTTDIVVGWELTEITQNIESHFADFDRSELESPQGGQIDNYKFNSLLSSFAAYNSYIYIVKDNNLHFYTHADNGLLEIQSPQFIGQGIASISVTENLLCVHMPSNLLVYSLQNPRMPKLLATVNNVLQCNPVTIKNNILFATIHSSNMCGQTENSLLRIRIPEHIEVEKNSVERCVMTKPKGLAFINDFLIVCDHGLKIFDPYAINIQNAKPLMPVLDIIADDIIPIQDTPNFILVKQDGLYLFDAANFGAMKQLSKIDTNFLQYP